METVNGGKLSPATVTFYLGIFLTASLSVQNYWPITSQQANSHYWQ